MTPQIYIGLRKKPPIRFIQFEWSDDGLGLLDKINADIENLGGRHRVADMIESESVKMVLVKTKNNARWNTWTDFERELPIKYHKRFMGVTIAKRLKKSPSAIHNQIYRLRMAGLIDPLHYAP